MEAIGLAGAVLGIIDVVTRCISGLAELRRKFKEANLTVEALSGQLATVRAALTQIHGLINERLTNDSQHYQLVIDLELAIKCCALLIGLIDEQVSKLDAGDAEALDFQSKVKIMLESKGTEDCLNRLDRQTSALNPLLTAFNRCVQPHVPNDGHLKANKTQP